MVVFRWSTYTQGSIHIKYTQIIGHVERLCTESRIIVHFRTLGLLYVSTMPKASFESRKIILSSVSSNTPRNLKTLQIQSALSIGQHAGRSRNSSDTLWARLSCRNVVVWQTQTQTRIICST